MIKFNLERALRGDAVITRTGKDMLDFQYRYDFKFTHYPYQARNSMSHKSHTQTFTDKGEVLARESSVGDLFMKYEENKTMDTFTKSDLKTGMFVKYRNGEYRMVLDSRLTSIQGGCTLNNFQEDITHDFSEGGMLDIIAVYKNLPIGNLKEYLEGRSLTLLWERTEQTEAQKEMEALNKQIEALQEQAKVLQSKL